MENASKALLMAGGIVLGLIIISLFMFTWGKISEYKSSKDELVSVKDTAQFNEQFTQYERDDILGYELLSLINKVIDYNERKTTDSNHIGEEQYPSITISINMLDETTRKQKFSYNNKNCLFNKQNYAVEDISAKTSTKGKASFEKQIIDKIEVAKNKCGGSEEALNRIAKEISSIFKTEEEIESSAIGEYNLKSTDSVQEYQKDNIKKQMLNKYNNYSENGFKLSDTDMGSLILSSRDDNSNEKYNAACTYYEFIQFKKAIFKCTNVEYDTNATGRIIGLDFEFTGKIR